MYAGAMFVRAMFAKAMFTKATHAKARAYLYLGMFAVAKAMSAGANDSTGLQ